MTKDELKQEIARLKAEIERHNVLYFEMANPLISDFEYDQLAARLKALEAEMGEPEPDSPTRKVGSDLSTGAKTIRHKVRMASLDNAYSLDELKAFINKTNNDLGQKAGYCAELKIDGFGINLFFEKGKLQYATTRGDGIDGEDVTANFMLLPQIPHEIACQQPIEIRGEIYIPLSDFLAMNEERRANEQKPFANPRNAAAGSIKLKDKEEVKKRNLHAIYYSLGFYEKPLHSDQGNINTQDKVLKWLAESGFPTSKHIVSDVFNEIETFCLQMEQDRPKLPFDIDGIVLKVNELEFQNQLGYTGKSPKWAIAYKFKPEEKETVLESVSFQVGRTGAITPVANLKSVYISGSTVSRATLHNADEIKRLDLCIGDTVKIVKSGEIIPKILSVDVSKRQSDALEVEFPVSCPVCGSSLQKDEDGSIHYCANASCPAQIQRRIEHFASRDAMDISGLGSSLIARLIEEGLIASIPDVYRLDFNTLATLERLGSKSAENLKAAIVKSKSKNFDKVLFALGIRHIGQITARSLALHFGDIQSLSEASMDDLLAVPDIGNIIALSLTSFFANTANLDMISELGSLGISFRYQPDAQTNTLTGKTFLITGTLPNYGRNEMENLILANGGRLLSGVSKQLNYLVVGDNPGSKLEKAQQLGTVSIISEAELLALAGMK